MAEDIDLTPDLSGLEWQWAVIVVDRWMQALQKNRIGVTHELQRSFEKELRKAGGNVDAVIFKFLKYGRFPDMGVGAGVSIGERVLNRQFDRYRDSSGRTTGHMTRQKKQWYTKTFYREVAKFRDLYQNEYAQQVAGMLESGMNHTLNLQP